MTRCWFVWTGEAHDLHHIRRQYRCLHPILRALASQTLGQEHPPGDWQWTFTLLLQPISIIVTLCQQPITVVVSVRFRQPCFLRSAFAMALFLQPIGIECWWSAVSGLVVVERQVTQFSQHCEVFTGRDRWAQKTVRVWLTYLLPVGDWV
jgi:hypothetical protein